VPTTVERTIAAIGRAASFDPCGGRQGSLRVRSRTIDLLWRLFCAARLGNRRKGSHRPGGGPAVACTHEPCRHSHSSLKMNIQITTIMAQMTGQLAKASL
jgi:hypothetical protein